MESEPESKMQAEMNRVAENTQAWLDENQKVFVCDFCARVLDPKTMTTFATKKDVTGFMSAIDGETLEAGTIELFFDSAWASCPTCAEVVKKGDPVFLAKHAMDYRDVKRVGPINAELRAMVEPDLVALYTRLYEEGLTEVKEVK